MNIIINVDWLFIALKNLSKSFQNKFDAFWIYFINSTSSWNNKTFFEKDNNKLSNILTLKILIYWV